MNRKTQLRLAGIASELEGMMSTITSIAITESWEEDANLDRLWKQIRDAKDTVDDIIVVKNYGQKS